MRACSDDRLKVRWDIIGVTLYIFFETDFSISLGFDCGHIVVNALELRYAYFRMRQQGSLFLLRSKVGCALDYRLKPLNSSAKVQLNQAWLATLRGKVRGRIVNLAQQVLLLLTNSCPMRDFEALEFDCYLLQQMLGCEEACIHTLLSV